MMSLPILPLFLRQLVQKEDSERTSNGEIEFSTDSGSSSEDNRIIFQNDENRDGLFCIPSFLPDFQVEKISESEEISSSSENTIIFNNSESNPSSSQDYENLPGNRKHQQKISEDISKTEHNCSTEKSSFERKSFICFTYYDKELNKNSEEPPYCVIEEKFIGYPPRNWNDVKKLLELSENHNNNSKTYVPRRPPKKCIEKRCSSKMCRKIRSYINEKITFRLDTGVIVWIPLVDFKIEFVHTTVKKFGNIVMIHDRWIKDDILKRYCWGGVLVVYTTPEEAEAAKTEIPRIHKFMKTLGLSELLHCLVKAESEHYEKKSRTDIFVNVFEKCKNENLHQLDMLLKSFGEVIPENCYQVIGEHSIRIATSYSCATYAFLAMTVLDGLPINGKKVKAEVNETEREKAILEDLRFHLRKYIGTAAFLFQGVY